MAKINENGIWDLVFGIWPFNQLLGSQKRMCLLSNTAKKLPKTWPQSYLLDVLLVGDNSTLTKLIWFTLLSTTCFVTEIIIHNLQS